MNIPLSTRAPDEIDYPFSDGKPMAEDTKQFDWIVLLAGNLTSLYRDDPNVFVKGDQFWYPVKGQPETVAAPDVYVVFGRPKGYRRSWKQWEENDTPMTVVFEVRSISNTDEEMADKQAFYSEHGVEEYYDYDPRDNSLAVFVRQGTELRRVRFKEEYTSPRLGVRFCLTEPEMTVYYPDGRLFRPFDEVEHLLREAESRADKAESRADDAGQVVVDMKARLARLAELSRKARKGTATPEELQELDRLEEPPA